MKAQRLNSNSHNPEAGEPLTELNINSSSTVQPNILLRTPVFTPSTRIKIKTGRTVDLGEAEELLIGEMEGYKNVRISGKRLSVEIDFKVWCGVVRVIQESGYTDNGVISLPFTKFARLCGYDVKRIDSRLRDRIYESIRRIMSQIVEFSKDNGDCVKMTHLVGEAQFDVRADEIRITPSPSLWGLYKMDYTTILKQKVFNALPKSELAVCLYMYIQSMPQNPKPRTMARLRERMRLTGEIKSQNRSIVTGLEKLSQIGYLRYHIVKKDGESYLYIDARDQNLKLNDIENSAKTDDENDE